MTRIWICGAALDITASTLPEECQEPMVIQMDINAMPSIMYSVSTTDGSDAYSLVNDTIVPELEAISTVADVQISGGREHYIRVLLDEEALNQYGDEHESGGSEHRGNGFYDSSGIAGAGQPVHQCHQHL